MEKYEYQNYILTKEAQPESYGTYNTISIFEDNNLVYKKSFVTAKPELNIPDLFTNVVIENIYTPDGEFLFNPIANSVYYLSSKDFDAQAKHDNKVNNLISTGKIKKVYKEAFKKTYRIPIEKKGIPYTDNLELLNKYRTLKDKYHSIENSIVYYVLLSSLKEIQPLINTYIATGSMDFEKYIALVNGLNFVSDIIPSTYPILLQFAKNPKDIDLRYLAELLSKSIKSINNIINLKVKESPFSEEYKGEEINDC